MEYSSPLAAMRPQPCHAWGNRKDLPIPRSYHGGYQTYGPNSFNFKELSMQQKPAKQDYFTVRPVRGSSPTSSLTADLDANFHIDKSPQAPTPRRSLFTTDLFKPGDDAGRLMTPPIEVDEVMTPDVPSSSPCFDAMDISPLPHKLPHFVAQVTLPSPTPEGTPELEDGISPDLLSPVPAPEVQPAVPAFPSLPPPSFLYIPERRRPVTRPSLSRTKAQSVNFVPQRSTGSETQLPPFRFGNVIGNGLSCSSTPSLLESFTESPIEDLKSESAQKMPPPPRRPSLGAASRSSGSPSTHHVRKPSGGIRQPAQRPPRKTVRRSLSMFQRPDDVMKEEQDMFEPQPCLAASVMDVDQEQKPHQPKLPCFVPDGEPDSLPRISQSTMVDVLDSKYNGEYERILIIDCRFEYEYNGGHIETAVNFNDKQQLANELFSSPSSSSSSSSTLLILHCEYSVHRAPLTAKFIRSHDRNINFHQYPNLSYPELYILDGGYSKFFEAHRAKCFPQNYVEMNDRRHEQACERGMAKVKQRQKLFRHQTFAFGSGAHEGMEDSPTAASQHGRTMGPRSQSTFDVGEDIAAGIGGSFARRMASY